ncbi:hypothetical protein F5Y15DRAFT_103050 [Xylariaceae sp. FL0016]|nr:hypothetical protein F5Y15DRAFT_103050 [Xylariaceae sp. FL0016]
MENPRDLARAKWVEAQKVRSDILDKINSLKKERGNVNYTNRFEELDGTIAELRLACVQILFHDYEYGVEKKVENSLWQAHVFLNNEYRKIMSRLMTQNQVVQRRKLDKLYRGFLKVSDGFYRVYIQQLSARFCIPELRQIAYGTDLETTETTDSDVPPSAPLRDMVLNSCQTTLVRLGDLARYRCQTSDKVNKATFEKALDYYGLANILDPDDGSAHHQTAVLYQLQNQHLDIVYHFHRAICIAKPHELALGNLEREYKTLENPQHSKRGPGRDPSEAMITWFVRLHSFFLQGKQFTQQSELENEVLHRIELAMKKDDTDGILRKMILTNIAAYDIATVKVKTSWTIEGSTSCQFLLRFNVRTILILLRLLRSAFLEESKPGSDDRRESVDDETTLTFGSSSMKLLPLFRIYIAWVYVVRADLVQYEEYLEPYLKEVYRLLADTLTALNVYIDLAMGTTSSKYLLPEDLDAQGLRPLGDPRLPFFWLTTDQQGDGQTRQQRVQKPRQIIFGRQFRPQTETVWRIRDIVCCGVFLAGTVKFPLALTTPTQTGRTCESWVFADDLHSPISSEELAMSRILSKLSLGDTKPTPRDAGKKASHKKPDQLAKSPAYGKSTAFSVPRATFETEVGDNSDMVNMVNKLLDPMEDSRPQSSHTQVETSYGMDSSMANEVFAQFESSPAQPSPASKALPSLPWGYFYTPTPHRSNSRGQNQLDTSNDYVPRTAASQLDGYGTSSYLNDLGNSFTQSPQDAFTMPKSGSYAPPSSSSRKSDEAERASSRNAVLNSLASALHAEHGFGGNNAQSTGMSSRLSASPVGLQRSASRLSGSSFPRDLGSPGSSSFRANLAPSQMERSSSQHYGFSTNMPSPLGAPGQGRPGVKSGSVRDGIGSGSKSTSPLANHFGLQQTYGQRAEKSAVANDATSGLFQQQYTSWVQSTPSTNFSHSSSIFEGTPSITTGGPANTVACNDNWFSEGAPYGGLGNGIRQRNDPTHFRNQLKAATGSNKLAYDPQILQAALLDNSSKPRPK